MTSGNRPAPEQGSWQVPGAASAYQPAEQASHGAGRGRPGLVALIVALVELVIIAAACNQAVYKHVHRYFLQHEATFRGRAIGSSTQFAWRLAPDHGDDRTWAGQLVTIGVFVVLSALLAGLAARGTVTFWRALFGVWTAVLAVACVARVAGAFVAKPQPGTARAASAVFDSVSSLTVFAGAVIGLITALIAVLFAVATRRAVPAAPSPGAPPEPAYVPEAPPPFYGGAPPQQQATPEADGRTTQIPRFDSRGDDGEATQALPRSDDGEATQAMPSAADDDRA